MLQDLLLDAVLKYGEITPCTGRTWNESVTQEETKSGIKNVLWFNDKTGSTRVTTCELDPDAPIDPMPWEPELDAGYKYPVGEWEKLYNGPQSLEEAFNRTITRRRA